MSKQAVFMHQALLVEVLMFDQLHSCVLRFLIDFISWVCMAFSPFVLFSCFRFFGLLHINISPASMPF